MKILGASIHMYLVLILGAALKCGEMKKVDDVLDHSQYY